MRAAAGKLASSRRNCVLWGGALLLFAGAKDSLKGDTPHAVVAGTVFRENGFALPGATVTLATKEALKMGASKMKKLQSVSGGRGEFAFHVPAEARTYAVRAFMKGFQSVEKDAFVSGEERVEVTLVLPFESK